MSLDTDNSASPESTQTTETTTDTTANQPEDQEIGLLGEQDDPDAAPQAEEQEELDVDGHKFAVPKTVAEKLRQERLMQADYTRKTQEVAETRQAIEQERQQIQVRQKQMQEMEQTAVAIFQEASQVQAIDQHLKQLLAIDYNAVVTQNPIEGMKLERAIRQLQDQRTQLLGGIQHKQQLQAQQRTQQELQEQQSQAKSRAASVAVLERAIPGFNEAKANELRDYAIKLGATPQQLEGLAVKVPAVAIALHKAKLFDDLQAKQTAKPKPTAQAAPVTGLKAKNSGTVDETKLSPEEWAKRRNQQLRARHKR